MDVPIVISCSGQSVAIVFGSNFSHNRGMLLDLLDAAKSFVEKGGLESGLDFMIFRDREGSEILIEKGLSRIEAVSLAI